MIEKEMYSMNEFADIIGVTYMTVWNWVNKDKIKYKRFPSGTIRIPKSELEI